MIFFRIKYETEEPMIRIIIYAKTFKYYYQHVQHS